MDSVQETAQEVAGQSVGVVGDGLRSAVLIDTDKVRSHVDEVVRSTVEQTLNSMLDAEADRICQAGRYERSADRADTRAGSYDRKLETKGGSLPEPLLRREILPLVPRPAPQVRQAEPVQQAVGAVERVSDAELLLEDVRPQEGRANSFERRDEGRRVGLDGWADWSNRERRDRSAALAP